MAYDHDLAARLERNPHNLPGDSAAPPMGNFDYWRARYQRDGLRARAGADCPHNDGTAAAQWWQEGRAYAAALSDELAPLS